MRAIISETVADDVKKNFNRIYSFCVTLRAQTSHGSKREAGDVWSKTRSRHYCHSRFIIALSTMPIKNDAIIYDEVYRYLFYSPEF